MRRCSSAESWNGLYDVGVLGLQASEKVGEARLDVGRRPLDVDEPRHAG